MSFWLIVFPLPLDRFEMSVVWIRLLSLITVPISLQRMLSSCSVRIYKKKELHMVRKIAINDVDFRHTSLFAHTSYYRSSIVCSVVRTEYPFIRVPGKNKKHTLIESGLRDCASSISYNHGVVDLKIVDLVVCKCWQQHCHCWVRSSHFYKCLCFVWRERASSFSSNKLDFSECLIDILDRCFGVPFNMCLLCWNQSVCLNIIEFHTTITR